MLVDLLLFAVLGLINFLIDLLPSSVFSSSINTHIVNGLAQVYQFDAFFPIDYAFILIGATIVFWGIILLWDFIKWVIHLIRGN